MKHGNTLRVFATALLLGAVALPSVWAGEDAAVKAEKEASAARLVSSLVTTPIHAKAMLRALASAIERYEQQFGEIPAIEPRPAAASPAAEPESPAGKRGRC